MIEEIAKLSTLWKVCMFIGMNVIVGVIVGLLVHFLITCKECKPVDCKPVDCKQVYPPVKKGYCHTDSNDWYILKTEDTPGWADGDTCWIDEIKTKGVREGCKGGEKLEKCESYIDSENNII
jgi:hypothetical protein